MGEVLRADWFDLADAERDTHRAWLHARFLPALQSAPGIAWVGHYDIIAHPCLLYTSPSPRDRQKSRMPSSA